MTNLMRLLKLHRLCDEAGETGDTGGGATPDGGETPSAPSSTDDGEPADPVVDGFLSGSTAAPTPAPAPAPAAPAPAPAAPAAPTPAPAAPAPTPAPAPSAPKPGEAPKPAAAPAPTPAPQPAPQTPTPAPTPAPQPTEPQPAPAPTPAQRAEEAARIRTEARNNYIKGLAEKDYAIPEDQRDALLGSPHEVLPTLAARVHTGAVDAALGAVISNFDALLEAAMQRRENVSKAEAEFYTTWPKLKDHAEGRQTAERLMAGYLAAHKGSNLTRQQIITDVGLLAMSHLRIPLDVSGAAPVPNAQPVVSAPPAPPAVPGGGGARPAAPKPTPWDKLDQELFQED
jgi:hypothetical protein